MHAHKKFKGGSLSQAINRLGNRVTALGSTIGAAVVFTDSLIKSGIIAEHSTENYNIFSYAGFFAAAMVLGTGLALKKMARTEAKEEALKDAKRPSQEEK